MGSGTAPGPRLFAAIAELADGWMPIGGAGVAAAIEKLRESLDAAGRDPAKLEVAPFGVVPDEGKLEHYRRVGVTEAVLRLPSAPRDAVLPALDELSRWPEQYPSA